MPWNGPDAVAAGTVSKVKVKKKINEKPMTIFLFINILWAKKFLDCIYSKIKYAATLTNYFS